MAQELVWAVVDGRQVAVGRNKAEAEGYEVLDESPRDRNGDVRRPVRANGRKAKPKTTVAKKAAANKKAAEVIASEPATTNEIEETSR